jgi:hypothetical protein
METNAQVSLVFRTIMINSQMDMKYECKTQSWLKFMKKSHFNSVEEKIWGRWYPASLGPLYEPKNMTLVAYNLTLMLPVCVERNLLQSNNAARVPPVTC